MHLVRRLTSTVLGRDPEDPTALTELQAAGVPVTDAPCRSCAEPCDEGHEEYSRRFDVDMESEMRGSVKPYRRQVLISTGKADWPREVTDVSDTLAKFLSDVNDKLGSKKSKPQDGPPAPSSPNGNGNAPPAPASPELKSKEKPAPDVAGQPVKCSGVFRTQEASRLSILNGSHRSYFDEEPHETVIVLPDYIVVSNVEASPDGAEALWHHAISPSVTRAGTVVASQTLKSWVLPYNCLIMLCSHKRRDTRCHIASIRLEQDFMHTLEAEGWHIDTNIEDLTSSGPALEDFEGTVQEREEEAIRRLKALSQETHKKALIVKNSHIGGHKFAGNVIIYFPQGSSIWYGRVTTHEVPSIVKNTIIQGKVLPPLLRGGANVNRPGRSSLLEW